MPNLDALKQMNKPPEAQQMVTTPYLPQVSAIPTQEWDAMLQSQLVLVERLAELGQYIATLPTTPAIEKAIRNYCQGIYDNQGDMLCRVIHDQYSQISRCVAEQVAKQEEKLSWQMRDGFRQQMQELRHRDTLPWKLRLKWALTGLMSSAALYTLLSLLKLL